MATTEAMSRMDGTATEEKVRSVPHDTPQTIHRTNGVDSLLDTSALITLIRRAPALAALREQPLDRRDLQEHLDVSKPTVHRLVRTLNEMNLIKRTNGIFVLTRLGEVVADVAAEFTRSVETAYRLTPLLEVIQDQYPDFDVAAFEDAIVTTAEPSNPYRPVQRYCSLVEETRDLRVFDATTPSPQHIDAIYSRVCDGMETQFLCPPAVTAHLLSAYPDQMVKMAESDYLNVRVHADLSHGLVLFDERVGIGSHCQTTGALQAFIDTDAPNAREWAETIYDTYWTEAERFEMHSELPQRPG